MKTRVFLITLCICFGFGFYCCGDGDKAENARLKVGYLPIAECLPLYVAKEKGYFEKNGLDVELVSATGGPVIFSELNAGTIDIGFSNVVSLIKQVNSGKQYVSVFGATYETPENVNHGMFIRRNATTSELAKLKFAVNARNNIEELMLLSYLKSKGVSINENTLKQLVEVPFPQMLTSLKDETVDVACIVEPFITIAKTDSMIYKYAGNHYSAEGSRILVATYVAKSSFLGDEGSKVQKFVSAMREATEEINRDNNASRAWIAKYAKMDDRLLSRISLPEFSNSVDSNELNKIIHLMYNEDINKFRGFIPDPNKAVFASRLIYLKD